MEKKNVLVADDAAFMRMMLGNMITSIGCNVITATDGDDAVQKFQQFLPDLVTLDLTMPIKSGLQALQEIKKINPDAKVIVISAMGQRDMVIKAIQSGANDFIVKPFDSDTVKRVIKENLP